MSATSDAAHIPVLFQETMHILRPHAGGRYIDGTVGAGGHTAGLLAASAPDGKVLAFDRDPEAISFARARLQSDASRVTFINASYAEMGQLAPTYGFNQVDGVLLDLGLSSRQLEDGLRGFSFLRDGPLDMRFDPRRGKTAADLINTLSETDLASLFWHYGEERSSRKIARAIVLARPLHTTGELRQVIEAVMGRRGRKHPATQVFQALRIVVNEELAAVEKGLAAGIDLLKPGGRMAVISFHSLEDRLVKQTFRQLSRDCVCPPQQPICTCDAHAVVQLVTRKAVQPGDEEIAANPRSRSARLRVVEKRSGVA
ncbi:MAG: 16S rRNA (cytosine(1402)-N(4))-methyltransferase RsmH [Anaerolineales bacterium]|nr:16S rRNA (cytosine(1402)-N(4))-methyltransferase RsmH [Anaerolineales bacterium]MCB8952338.1 16S rRNA (cytosine(1402)-N(4))-methyltransferase RsmH [Ardenticatenales bacterium]